MTAPDDSYPTEDAPPAPLDPLQRDRLTEYLRILLLHNELFNLTAITDPDAAWQRHVVETLRLVPLLGESDNLIDVGSGGGVPGLVLAVARPALHVTLLEATQKKARFLEQTAETLGLANVAVIAERAEVAGAHGSPHRQAYGIVTARAVAPLRTLLELTVPFARIGGLVLAVKGEQAPAEVDAAAKAMRVLHVELERAVRHPTASVLLLRKRAATPTKYPRRPGEPKRSPL